MIRRRFVLAAGATVATAGCLGDDGPEEEVVRIDDRVLDAESFEFDVAEDDETEIVVHVREVGVADVELLDPREEDDPVISDTLEYVDSSVKETYTPTLDPGVVYTLDIDTDSTVIDVVVTSYW